MLQSFMLRVLCLLSISLLAICMAGSGAAPLNVTGTLGQSASLSPGIPVGIDVAELEWKKTKSVVLYVKGNITYFGSEDFKSRLTLDPASFSLQIRDLRREDAGDYEALATAGSGDEYRVTVRLEVYEPVSGTHIKVQNMTGNCDLTLTCSVTSGNPSSFSWWRGGEAVGNDSTHHLWEHSQTVSIHHTGKVNDTNYRCEVRNPISLSTANIWLRDLCNITTKEPSGLTMIEIIIISSVSSIFVIVLLICLLCFIIKNVKHRQKPQITGEPPPVETEYAVVQPVQSHAAGRQTRQGNEMVHGHNDWLEVPNTVYATVNSPGNPAAEPDRGKRGARRNVRDSSFEMYETVNYPGIPRMATIRTGAGARGKSPPI
ncbi:SLAM family member 5-like isoform X1 [Hemitrygon akajei]|uniref:SLAM family member 5-like isoform X1 n=1 Tax=Hemitrygon akajei TaxID=2704970 RepID=UPI003BFA32E2